ncbi:hypothetical protein F0A17_16220 [Billgrantia pellis]|uniref:DUF2971 domain-containing protein n=1 Tax=Billgrantia pellis TaxID=2606936 RepID=A0A7V7KH55_9GAMM|nr:hypothetical protein [Halomonas pellis]KAA0010761.1 hypothetical protein F0A17_16220 [Halomonas pellis]
MAAIIQRYMDLPKFVNLIQTNSLYFSKMSAFEDALEGGLTVSDFFKTSNMISILDIAVNGALPPANEDAVARVARLEGLESKKKEIEKRQFHTPFGSYPCDEAERLFPACKEWLYVSCWHQSEHECAAMWKLFGRDKNSVCIFSTIERLEASIVPDPTCDMLKLWQVNYIDHSADTFSVNPIDPFIAKSKPYAFEREFRVVSWNSRKNLLTSPKNDESGRLLKVNLEEMIHKVVVSPHADPWFKSTIKQLCEDAKVNVIVEDSVMGMQPISDIYQAMSNSKLREPEV